VTGLLSPNSNLSHGAKRMFVVLLVLGFGLRMSYGVLRYRSTLNRSGNAFINLWDHDPLYHVLIAKALLSGKGYVVDDFPASAGKQLRYVGQEALFKAPMYEFFLAGVFLISGFSFKLFFPLQALLGGLAAAFTGLISLNVFHRQRAAWFAGLATAAQPILVNAAPQPYNEDLFFLLFVVSIWAFLVWLQTDRVKYAVLCATMIGLCMLTRETGSLLLAAMGVVVLAASPMNLHKWTRYCWIATLTIAVVAPWTLRNYVRFAAFVPVASIVGVDFTEGNNQCVASESIFVPYWAEGPCPSVDEERRVQMQTRTFDARVPACVRLDLASRQVALQFVKNYPLSYAKLTLRRFWTSLLPYNPRGNQHRTERIVLLLYWLAVFPAGVAGLILGKKFREPGRMLLALVIALNLLSIAAVLYWSDLRFLVGVYLLLACFAGWTYDELILWRERQTRPLA